jgi:hypothetical protein
MRHRDGTPCGIVHRWLRGINGIALQKPPIRIEVDDHADISLRECG